MDPAARDALEADIQRLCREGEVARAADLAIRGYGPELFGFLVVLHRDGDDAADLFATVSEELWAGLDAFEWECTFRTWAYTVARNASLTFHGRPGRRTSSLSSPSPSPSPGPGTPPEVAARVPAGARTYVGAPLGDRIQLLRESLSRDEQMLLTLRVDRELSWDELARVFLDERKLPTPDAYARESVRLQEHFQQLKERLTEQARKEGLLGAGSGAKGKLARGSEMG